MAGASVLIVLGCLVASALALVLYAVVARLLQERIRRKVDAMLAAANGEAPPKGRPGAAPAAGAAPAPAPAPAPAAAAAAHRQPQGAGAAPGAPGAPRLQVAVFCGPPLASEAPAAAPAAAPSLEIV
jgi:hypothetical protein